ncbi:MAG: hypothetical protein ACXVPN_05325 [Bacteroidia bacterium]
MFLVSKQKAAGEGSVKTALLLLFFSFMLVSNESFSLPKDSTKNKYELNDPRNPNCPCHKNQQLAEQEYRQLQGNLNNVNKFTNDDNAGDQFGNNNNASEFGIEKMKLGFDKISFGHSKRVRAQRQETANDKKGKTNGIFREIYVFRVVRMKFPASGSHAVKHRKMKGRFGDKLSRCFHF